MRQFRIILAAEGWHLDYVPVATMSWKKFFPEMKISLAIVRDNNRDHEYYFRKYAQYVDTLVSFPDVDDVCRSSLAKMARLCLSTGFGDEICTLHDIDFCPLQRGFYEDRYAQYEDGKLMLMGLEVYNQTERGRAPISAMTAPSEMFRKVLDINGTWFDFVDAWRKTGERSPENKDDVLNAPYFSDEILMRTCLRRMGREWILANALHIERGYNMQEHTLDRACWNLADWNKLFRGEYLEAHLLKAYKPNLVVNDKEFDTWGYIPGLLPILDYIGFEDPYMDTAIDEAVKLYGKERTFHCLNYKEAVCV